MRVTRNAPSVDRALTEISNSFSFFFFATKKAVGSPPASCVSFEAQLTDRRTSHSGGTGCDADRAENNSHDSRKEDHVTGRTSPEVTMGTGHPSWSGSHRTH